MPLDFPSSPTNGQVYQQYVYDSSLPGWRSKGGAVAATYTSDTAPSGAVKGDMWYRTSDGTTYVYVVDADTSQWVEIRSEISTAKVGMVPVLASSIVLGSGTATSTGNGLVTFSGANYVRLRNVFTSAYRNYHINIGDVNTQAGNTYAYLQLNVNNADNGVSYYTQAVFNQIGSAISAYNVNSGGGWDLGPTNAGNEYFASSIDMYSPAAPTYTKAVFRSTCGTGGVASVGGGLLHAVTSSFDGITLFNYNNTAFSGNIQVYGWN